MYERGLAHGIEIERGGAETMRQTETLPSEGYLDVDGARLYYAVAGSGPVLLLIPGGFADADGFLPVLDALTPHYTVVRYDPRGISRSRGEGLTEDVPVEVHAADARHLLAAIGSEPAHVLGSSGGAVIGLALAAAAPEAVQTLVAHEPPLTELLPESDPRRLANQEIYDTYLASGPEAAMGHFFAASGMDESGGSEMSPEVEQAMEEEFARIMQNADFFFAHYLMPVTKYQPDIEALTSGPSRIVVAVGEDSAGQEASDTTLALAEQLGVAAEVFPGDHVGMFTKPEAFVDHLLKVLQAGA
jgi:pimeloyl-ACP methyl ester carboxylesterase